MIALWVGLECTVNRVGASYHDQIARTGHAERLDDIDRIAALGVGRVRYPLLWERLLPSGASMPLWDRVDAHMERIRAIGLAPIAGLVHHGSGPRHTSLLDPGFPGELAAFAGLVAQRYPWIDAWTPINEPLVTARFSGLYGLWYPHHRDDASFCRIVVTECQATILAMAAIRRVTPHATYVHTDDAGTVYSTPPLEYQADFENARRDLVLDLLHAQVTPAHAFWSYLLRHGVTPAEIAWIGEQGCTPDIIGLDYYATSDRFLDHRLGRYPAETHGGNFRHRYADVAAAGNRPEWRLGVADALMRVFSRYGTPVALTEVHMGCTREEQLRWLHAVWNDARKAADAGACVRAVTSWALFGTFDWHQLATTTDGHYEPGAFDVRGRTPRRTAIGRAVHSLATTGTFAHPVLSEPGWWDAPTLDSAPQSIVRRRTGSRLLILGGHGTLGAAFVRHCESRRLAHLALTRAEVDIRDAMEVRRAVAACRPWAVINATGYVDVDGAEADRAECDRVNVQGALNIAEACSRIGARMVNFSSDLVFDGRRDTPYDEQQEPGPLSAYGECKARAEGVIRAVLPTALLIRTSAFFGPADEHNFVTRTLRLLAAGQGVQASSNVVSPTYVPALVDATLDLLVDYEEGIWHLANQGAMSWSRLAQLAADMIGFDGTLVRESLPDELGWVAVRPAYSALASVRGTLLPSVEASLERYFHSRPLARPKRYS